MRERITKKTDKKSKKEQVKLYLLDKSIKYGFYTLLARLNIIFILFILRLFRVI